MRAKDDFIENSKQFDRQWKTSHPLCIHCGKLARPAILMFGDWKWAGTNDQQTGYYSWKRLTENILANNPKKKLVIVEIGCGLNVPTVRHESESWLSKKDIDQSQITLIRINPDYPHVEQRLVGGKKVLPNVVSIKSKGKEALIRIDKYLTELKKK